MFNYDDICSHIVCLLCGELLEMKLTTRGCSFPASFLVSVTFLHWNISLQTSDCLYCWTGALWFIRGDLFLPEIIIATIIVLRRDKNFPSKQMSVSYDNKASFYPNICVSLLSLFLHELISVFKIWTGWNSEQNFQLKSHKFNLMDHNWLFIIIITN